MLPTGIIAYRKVNGKFDLHRTNLLGENLRLWKRITETRPFDQGNESEQFGFAEFTRCINSLVDHEEINEQSHRDDSPDMVCVDPEPFNTNVPIKQLIRICDEETPDSLYIVETDFSVYGYLFESVNIGSAESGNILFTPSWNPTGPDKQSIDELRTHINSCAKQADQFVQKGILSESEAHDVYISQLLDEFVTGDKHILAYSSFISPEYYNDHWASFLGIESFLTVLGKQISSSYTEMHPWQIPDEFEPPTSLNKINPRERFPEVFNQREVYVEQADSESQENKEPGSNGPSDEQMTLTELTGAQNQSDSGSQSNEGTEDGQGKSIRQTKSAGGLKLEESSINVQIPLKANRPGLRINGVLVPKHDLPGEAYEAYQKYMSYGGSGIEKTKVHECSECVERSDGYPYGYLTTSTKIGDYKNPYTCPATWEVEKLPINGYMVGRFAPNPWEIQVAVNGDSQRILAVNTGEKQREYEITIQKKDSYGSGANIIDSTTVTISPSSSAGLRSVSTDTIKGETDGQQWELALEFPDETIKGEWCLLTETGDPVTYAYKQTKGTANKLNETIGFNPPDSIRENEDNVVVTEMQETFKSHVRERECGSEDFVHVWPDDRYHYEDRMVNPHNVTADDVPNSSQHLSRIQSETESEISQQELIQRVKAVCQTYKEELNLDQIPA